MQLVAVVEAAVIVVEAPVAAALVVVVVVVVVVVTMVVAVVTVVTVVVVALVVVVVPVVVAVSLSFQCLPLPEQMGLAMRALAVEQRALVLGKVAVEELAKRDRGPRPLDAWGKCAVEWLVVVAVEFVVEVATRVVVVELVAAPVV